jgi:REP element-mobilizing transposase RayT
MRLRASQMVLAFRSRGGRRKGAGRKRKPGFLRLPHSARERINERLPAHVTLKMMPRVPSLRLQPAFAVVKRAILARGASASFRILEFSVQDDHVHLLVEADDNPTLARGVQGLNVRIARGINKLRKKAGTVFRDRYHSRVLKTPREVTNALKYVLLNGAKHIAQSGRRVARGWLDPRSSAPSFDGWTEKRSTSPRRELPRARSWLLARGWREKCGLIDPADVPGVRLELTVR